MPIQKSDSRFSRIAFFDALAYRAGVAVCADDCCVVELLDAVDGCDAEFALEVEEAAGAELDECVAALELETMLSIELELDSLELDSLEVDSLSELLVLLDLELEELETDFWLLGPWPETYNSRVVPLVLPVTAVPGLEPVRM